MIFHMYVMLLFCGLVPTNCQRLLEQIYSPISASNTCFRRLNGTHQAGCSSPKNGAVGVVQMIKDIDDAKWLVTDASAGPYMAIVHTSLFNNVIELFMENPESIAGVLIYDTKDKTNRAQSFSLESQCPNEYYGSDPESQCSSTKSGSKWNSKGSGLIRRDIPFSIIYTSVKHNDDVVKIEECYERYNKDKNNQRGRALCSLQINSFMYAAVSSELCMKRSLVTSYFVQNKLCDPIGDYNVYYSLFPRVQVTKNTKESVTLVSARIDSASLFDQLSPGAASSVVGMVTLVTTAVILSKMIPVTDMDKYDHNIMFTLFNGEAFDYIGSQRVAYDLNRGVWPEHAPLSPEDITLHVEVGQIGGSLQDPDTETPNAKWPMYAFTPDNGNSEVIAFVNEMSKYYNQFNESLLPTFTASIPPSSLHSFRRILRNYTDTLPGIVIADHKESFTNMFYNSALDEYYQLGYNYRNKSIADDGTFISTEELIATGVMNVTDVQVKIARLATALARTLYKRVVDEDYIGNLTVSAHLVDELLYCYTRSQACTLMKVSNYGNRDSSNFAPTPPLMYASVMPYVSNPAVFTGNFIVLLTGAEVMAPNETECKGIDKPGYRNFWLKGWNYTGVCMQTSMNLSDALSPAFIIKDYDWKSGVYSTWTESVWQEVSARIFVSATGAGATVAATSGVAATFIAAFLTFWIKRHKDVMFVNAGALAAMDDSTSGILRTVNC